MKRTDARRLSPPAQEDLRRRVVYAVVKGGMGQAEAARTFGVCRQAVAAWVEKVEAEGARAKAEDALILWGDEMGLRSDDPVGRTYAPRGKTPIVQATGRRFGCNMISAISNLGRLWFMVFACRLTAKVFVGFLGRLLRATGDRKVFLIVDSHPAHRAAAVRDWLAGRPAERAARLELFFLPG